MSTAAAVAAIAADVLRRDHVGERDDLYALGVDSLALIQVLSRVHETLGADLDFLAALQTRTAAELARLVADGATRPASGDSDRPVPRPGAEAVLTPFQERVLYDMATYGYLPAHASRAYRIRGCVNVDALRRACERVVHRHDNLRARFPWNGDTPGVVVDDAGPLAFSVATAIGREDAERVAFEVVSRPFDPVNGPLYRFSLVTCGEDEHLFLIALHELLGDGWSINVIARELRALYPAELAGAPSPLPDLELQYYDYAAWQRARLTPDAIAEMRAFWREELRDAPVTLAIPFEGGGLPTPSPRPARSRTTRLGDGASRSLREFAAERAVTPFVPFLAVWGALLSAYAGVDDLVVYTPVANRRRVEAEPLVGLLATGNLPLRVDLSDDPTLTDLVDRLRDMVGRTFAHSETPVEVILDAIAETVPPGVTRQLHPRFRYRVPVEPLDLPGTTSEGYQPWYFEEHVAFWVDDDGPGHPFRMTIAYDSSVFAEPFIDRMLGYAARFVDRLVAEPNTPLSEVDALSNADREPLRAPVAEPGGDAAANAAWWLATRHAVGAGDVIAHVPGAPGGVPEHLLRLTASCGATLAVAVADDRADLRAWMAANAATVASVPVEAVEVLLADPPPSLRVVLAHGRWPAGATLAAPEHPAVEAHWLLPEHGGAVAYAVPRDGVLAATYVPVAGVALTVTGPHGRPVPRGGLGTVTVASPAGTTATDQLGRVLEDGTLALFGRTSDEVMLRGYRLTEVAEYLEPLLASHDDVAGAAVGAAPDGLIAYVVPAGGGCDLDAVGEWLAERSGGIRPARYIAVPALPVRADGTVDPGALGRQTEREVVR